MNGPQPPAPSTPPATVFLAGPDMTTQVLRQMYPAFQDTARYQVLSMAIEWEDIKRQVAQYRPEALVVDADVAPGPEVLRDFLGQLVGTIVLVVLPPAWVKFKGMFEGIQTNVRGVYLAPVNWAAIANATYSAVATERARNLDLAPATGLHRQAAPSGPGSRLVVGTRTIAFTSFAGGTGKSTIAEALAVELAREHIKTLLCSFNSPPAAAGHLGLKFSPNATEWLNRPTVEGFLASLQHVRGFDDLDVLLAPNDPHILALANARAMKEPGSIQNLVLAAYSFNYGAILLDLPPFADSMWAMQALLAANVAVLVCRPTLHDQYAAIRAYRLLTEELGVQARLPPDAIFAVLNFTTPDDSLSAKDFQAAIIQFTGPFPPLLAAFPFIAKLPAVQNRLDLPAIAPECDEFGRAVRSLKGKLVGGALGRNSRKPESDTGLLGKVLGITFRVQK